LKQYNSAEDHAGYLEHLQSRSFVGHLYRKFWLYPRLSAQMSGRVLDVGCGIGDFLEFRRGAIGVDINPLLVDYCLKRGLDARVMTPGNLPFPDASFDSVVLDNVLEHIADPSTLLREIQRVLVRGGAFVVGVPGIRGYAAHSDHKVFYDDARLTAVLGQAGFSKVRLFQMPVRSDWLDRNMRQYCLYGVFRRDG
jgi:SAM-dependent methyltransferase